MKFKGIDVDNSKQNSNTNKVNWTKILGKAGNGAKSIFEPIMPATFGTVTSTSNMMKDLRYASRISRLNQSAMQKQKSLERNSSENRKSIALFKSAMDDLNSGNYSIDRINDDLYDDYESQTSQSFEMPTGDDAADMSSEEILLLGNKGVAQSIVQGSSAQIRALQETSNSIIKSNSKSIQALSLSLSSTISHGLNSLNSTLILQNQKIDNLNSTMQGILEFNNTNALEFYTKSIDMIAGLGKMMENLDKTLNPPARKQGRRFDTSNGFDIKAYIDYVKEGFKESSLKSSASMGMSIAKDYGIFGILSDFLVPDSIKKPLQKFDKSVNRFFDESLKKLGDKFRSDPTLNFITSLLGIGDIGDIIGSKRETRNSLNLGNYLKDATPWNGIAQKALVEVIPELLTSIDSKIDKSEKRYYDYEKGQFKNKSTIEEEFKNEYFDTISIALSDAMSQLNKSLSDSGRSSADQKRLKAEIQAIIDDQITGNMDTMTARRTMNSKMENFGINKNDIRDFMMEFQDGLEGAISRINDLYNNIEKSQNVYRNINNTYRDEYTREINNMHKSHKADYGTFSFLGGIDYESYIRKAQQEAGISLSRIDLSKNNELQLQIMSMLNSKASKKEILNTIKDFAIAEELKNEDVESRFKAVNFVKRKVKSAKTKINSRMDKVNSVLTNATDTVMNLGYDAVYMEENPFKSVANRNQNTPIVNSTITEDTPVSGSSVKSKPRFTSPAVKMAKGKATTFLTKNKSNVTTEELRSLESIEKINDKSYDKYADQSEIENNDDQIVMSKALDTLNKAPMADSVESAIIQSNNMLRAGLGVIAASFKGFTSRLFGKEGFFRKLWDSDARKKGTKAIKEKLFTGENAIFKKQYESAKSGLKNIKNKTIRYLGKGYDFLYDNTMQYLYDVDAEGNPIDYNDSEKWKNNTFLSQTLNRRYHEEQKKKKAEAEKAKTIEAVNSLNENVPTEKDTVNPVKEIINNSSLSEIIPKELEDIKEDATDKIKDASEEIKNAFVDTTINVNESAKNLKDSIDAATDTFVGDHKQSAEKKKKSFFEKFKKDFKDTAPKALAGAIGGALLGSLNNSFSLLGSMFLPGGPIAGAIVGGGLTLLSQTEAFKTFMFGKLDPNTQQREGGLISEKMRAKFKQLMPYATGGAVIGGVKGLLTGALGFHGGLGILGMQILPGGILGGALLGAGLGILKQSDSFKDLLFGKKNEDGKRSGTILSNSFKRVKSSFEKLIPGIKKAGKGLAIGALSGAVLSHAGYIPAMLSLGGPVGMGIAGLGIGIASSTKKFNEWMFGSEQLDENGNPTGKRNKDGVLNRVTNILKVNVVEPISTAFKTKMLDLVDWTKDKITYPFRLAMGPILDSLIGIKDNVVDFVEDKFEKLGNGIMSLMQTTIKSLFNPVTKLIGGIGKSIVGMASSGIKLALSPLSVGLQGLQLLTAGKRRKEYIDFYKNYYSKGNLTSLLQRKWAIEEEQTGKKKNIFGKISDTIGTYLGQGDIADAAREGWNSQMEADGKNHLNWRSVNQEKRKMKSDRAARRKDEKMWRAIDKYRIKIVNDDLDGREAQLTDYQFNKYKDKFVKLGLSEDSLQTSDDIMDLLYRRGEFKNKLNPGKNGTKGLVVEETPEQKSAREKTEKYQSEMTDLMREIAKKFGIDAKNLTDSRILHNADRQWRDDKRNLSKRLRSSGMKNIDIDDPELRDFDINELDEDTLNKFRFSRYYKSGDLLGFMKKFGITQKSKFRNTGNPVSNTISNPRYVDVTSRSDIPRVSKARYDNDRTEIFGSDKAQDSILNNLAETNQKLLAVTTESKDMMSAQTEINTGGKLNAKEIAKRKGRKLGSIIAAKYNSLTGYIKYKTKQAKIDAENAESKSVRDDENIDITTDDDKSSPLIVNQTSEKKESLWDKIKNGIGGIASVISSSTAGGVIIKAAKAFGLIGALSAVGLGIMEVIKPGTQKNILDKTKEMTDSINNGNFYEGFVKPKMNTLIDALVGSLQKGSTWISENFPDIFEKKIIPRIEDGVDLISKNAQSIVDIAVSLITAFAPALSEAALKVIPTVTGSFAKAMYNAIIGKITNIYPFGKNPKDEKIITDDSIPDLADKEALINSINTTGKGSYFDNTTGEMVDISAQSAEITEDGEIKINYNEKGHEANKNTLKSAGRAVVGGMIRANRGGIIGKIARTGGRLPFQIVGGTIGAGAGMGMGTLVKHPIAGATIGVKKGIEAGNKIADSVIDSGSRVMRNGPLKNLLTQRVGEGLLNGKISGVGNYLSKGVKASNVSISKDVLAEVLAKSATEGSEEATENLVNDAIRTSIEKTLANNNQAASSEEAILRAIQNSKNKLMKETGSESVTDLAKNLIKENADNVISDTASEGIKSTKKGIVQKVLTKCKDFISSLSKNETIQKIISKFTADNSIIGKFIKRLSSLVDDVFEKVFADGTVLSKFSTKISNAMADLGLKSTPLVVLLTGYDLVSGAYNAENLFMIKAGEADWLMDLISALFNAFPNIPGGVIIDLIIQIAGDLLNRNFKCEWATSLYNAMAPDDGGVGLIGDLKLGDEQIALQIATDKYNASHGTNISLKEYNDKVNKGLVGTLVDAGKSSINKVTNFFTNGHGTKFETKWNSVETVSQEEINNYRATGNTGYGNGYSTVKFNNSNLGYGEGYSQGDSRWRNTPIGLFPNGSVATMKDAGCGPTALATVMDTVKKRQLGYGSLTPKDVAMYASANGYITNGGANAGLFTEGAKNLGLKSTLVTNKAQLKENLLAGRPTVLTGRSESTSDPYTKAGHIVVADGISGDRMSIMDPITGRHRMYDIDETSRNTQHAWAYTAAGYGAFRDREGLTKRTTNNTSKRVSSRTNSTSGRLSTRSSSTRNTRSENIYSTSGLTDSALSIGYHTEDSGIDIQLMKANYEYFNKNDNYYHRRYSEYINKLDKEKLSLNGRTGKAITDNKLAYILSTQYFGLNGGIYGSIQISKQTTSIKNINSDLVCKIFAAAIMSENLKESGGLNINAPLSKAEKYIAFANACRVMYGLIETIKFLYTGSNYTNLINTVKDEDYSKLVSLNNSIGSDVTTAAAEAASETSVSGIMNAEQLKAFAKTKNGFGKLALIGKISQAKINAILNGTDFWEELAKLTTESSSSGNSSGNTILQGISTSLSKAINDPDNIQEELLGKTIENIYREESGGNYASVIVDSNGTISLGPYHANSGNAVNLLKQLQGTQGLPSNLRDIYSKYANMISQGKSLTDNERRELSAALGDESNKDLITKTMDTYAMKFYNDLFYRPHFAGYYDNGTIKDLRTFPLLADIGNTSPRNIFDTSRSKAFISNWTPTTKEKELESAFNTLNKSGTFWRDHKYSKGYMNRIQRTYNNLKDYTIKRPVNQGELSQYFNKETNPLGFGPLDSIGNIATVLNDKVDPTKNEKLKNLHNSLNQIGTVLTDHLTSKLGVNTGDLGLTGNSNNSSDGSTFNSSDGYTYNGTYDLSGEQLRSLSGTDRDRFLAAAESQVGYLEKKDGSNLKSFTANYGSNDYTKYAKEIGNMNSAAWCNFFTSWAGKAAGIPVDIVYRGGKCSTTMQHYIDRNLYKPVSRYHGKPGDLVFFNWNGGSSAQHIGIVTGSNGDNLYTIEGNTTMNGSKVEGAEKKTRHFNSGSILGFATPPWTNQEKTVDPSSLLSLGYGNTSKIDSPAKMEQMRRTYFDDNTDEEFKINPNEFKELGFGPGMKVDAGFDMSSTDGKLDQIFGLIAEWFAEEKKNKAAQSASNNNVNVIDARRTTNVTPIVSNTNNQSSSVNAQKNRTNLVNQHLLLSSKKNIRKTI